MALIFIPLILFIGLALVATEPVNKMNKAAVAMFVGVICWLIYIGFGTSFVVSQHPIDFLSYISSVPLSSTSVIEFIAKHIFPPYITSTAEVVLYLIATMTIVEVLSNNGCFDFLREWLRTRSPRRFLWSLVGITFLLSANLDNLTTAILMLGIVHTVVADRKQRFLMGAAVVVSANAGGALTVIGDVTSLTFWTKHLISPTAYAGYVVLPALTSLAITTILIMRSLPSRLNLIQIAAPYRGDDTTLSRWQRLMMLLVGIGGLWFIPTFHRITLLPPYLGALCVLSLLWIVHELSNRRLYAADQNINQRQPMALQYLNLQNILFFIGIALAFGAVQETGLMESFFRWATLKLQNFYLIAAAMGVISAIINNVTVVLANVSLFTPELVTPYESLTPIYASGGVFWPLLSYSTSAGGTLLPIGTMAGLALMRVEQMSVRWYFVHITPKILVGWAAGLAVFYIAAEFCLS